MYRSFYQLEKKPFELVPDGGLVYLSPAHREGLAVLRHGVMADKGFILITGGVGMGKTTVLNALLELIRSKVKVCVINNPKLSRQEFFHYVGKKLDIPYDDNKGRFIFHFNQLLDEYKKSDGKLLLIIDEAQVAPIGLLEEVRLLSNHVEARNVLSIFLVGQPELQKTIAHPKLLPLRQRLGYSYHLHPFSRLDTEQYIVYRLKAAGAANAALFDSKAVSWIHRASQGNPRMINIICEQALMTGYLRKLTLIGSDVIEECVDDIQLEGEDILKFKEPDPEPVPDIKSSEGAAGKGRSIAVLAILFTLFSAVTAATIWLILNVNLS